MQIICYQTDLFTFYASFIQDYSATFLALNNAVYCFIRNNICQAVTTVFFKYFSQVPRILISHNISKRVLLKQFYNSFKNTLALLEVIKSLSHFIFLQINFLANELNNCRIVIIHSCLVQPFWLPFPSTGSSGGTFQEF